MFEWVLKFRIWVLTVMIGTCMQLMSTYAPEFTVFGMAKTVLLY